MAGITELKAARVAQAPAKAPPKQDLMRGRLTAVTEAFILLYQGSMAKEPEAVRSAAMELHKNAVQFAGCDQLKPALEGVLQNGADPTGLILELGRVARETSDSSAVDEMLDCAVSLMKSSSPLTSDPSAKLARLLFRDASQNARALALEECISMVADGTSLLQKRASGFISETYRYLDMNAREFILQSLEHIQANGVSPEAFDPVPKMSSKETATALLALLDSAPAKVICLSADESGVWRVL
jgi:hypothetical protein